MYYLYSSPVVWGSLFLFLCRYGLFLFILGKNSRTTIDSVFGHTLPFEDHRFHDRLIEGLFQFIFFFGLVGLKSFSQSLFP
jgi:hypothetical protein